MVTRGDEKLRQFDSRNILIAVQSLIIAALLSWLSIEYEANLAMQAWLAQNFWPGAILLDGRFTLVLAGSIIVATVFFVLRNIKKSKGSSLGGRVG